MKKMFILVIVIITMFVFSNTVFAYKQYKIGDTVKYNDIDFYVIKDSSREEDIVTLLKAEPLTVDEVNRYGKGHINTNVTIYENSLYYHKAPIRNEYGIDYVYGSIAYFSSDTCGYDSNGNWEESGCTIDYDKSDVKYVIDSWVNNNFKIDDIKETRLIKLNDLVDNFGFEYSYISPTVINYKINNNSSWIYDCAYWTMSPNYDSDNHLWVVSSGFMFSIEINNKYSGGSNVRPVVVLYKSAIDNGFISDDNIDDKSNKIIDNGINLNEEKQEIKETIKVPNTLKSISGLIILIGMVLVCIGINIFIIVKNRNGRKKERI